MILSRENVAQILAQVGFSGEMLVKMVAIAGRESSYNPNAHRTNTDPSKLSGDRGLFQINWENDAALMAAGIISSKADLFDPVVNARAAKWLVDQAGGSLNAWNVKPGVGWVPPGTPGSDPLAGTNISAARTAVQNAEAQGLLGQSYSGGTGGTSTYGAPQTTGMSTQDTGAHVTLPPDAQIIATNGFSPYGGGYVFAVFDIGGVRIAYDVMSGNSNWKDFSVTTVDQGQWAQMGIVNGGDVQELSPIKDSFGTYKDWFSTILDTVMGPYNPAREDPEVLAVIAEYASRPDMTEAELQGRLERTQYWNTRTAAQLEWNGLSQAEKDQRIAETQAQAADVWFRQTGVRIDPSDPQIAHYAGQIASGALGWGAFQTIVQKFASDNPESPYSRETRTEQEAQRQRPIDIENTAQNIRNTLNNWGIQWTNEFVLDWARQIVEKTKSDDDLMQAVKQQAATLYPWKDPEMETRQAAQPWLQTYEAVMEQTGSLTTNEIRRALTAGQPVWEFEQELKKNPVWATTRNGQSQISSLVADIGARMGYQ